MEQPFVHIIILNWNRPADTIACLASLEQITYTNYGILLIDNHSDDSSVERITDWLKVSSYEYTQNFINSDNSSFKQIEPLNRIQVIVNSENSGFAKGNNIGIDMAIKANSDLVLLLNNDTEVSVDFLDKLVAAKTDNPELAALTPQIRLFSPKDVLWNCGGRLILGGFWKKYYYSYTPVERLKEEKSIKLISFVTGCALLFDPNELGMLTEDFFFGEEDFEFSLRLKRANKKMGCVIDSIIYHKVGTSLNNVNGVGKRYVHILNRLVNTRRNNFSIFWPFLAIGIVFYNFIALLSKEKLGMLSATKFSLSLLKDGVELNTVDKDMFIDVLYNRKW